MRKNILKLMSKSFAVVISFALIISILPINNYVSAAGEDDGRMIVVSLGDSYSSGEGIEEFYGQNKSLANKINDEDWLAHRSKESWPGLLKVPGIDGTMRDYRNTNSSSDCEWYFVASSGATTKHLKNRQYKDVRQKGINDNKFIDNPKPSVSAQLDVFDEIGGSVDYVTLTIGGNDVEFSKIITTCATKNYYLHWGDSIEEQMDKLWRKITTIKSNIKDSYTDVATAAPNAEIIVAGYPKLLDQDGNGVVISKKEAAAVNSNVSKFNNVLETIVNECRNEGMKIHFVDVEEEFNNHEAYSDNQWINKIKFPAQDQELDYKQIGSAYSVHPNAEGAKAYARCVNEKIAEIEASKQNTGTISGMVRKATDRFTPISNADIKVYKNNNLYCSLNSDTYGNYSKRLPVGEYKFVISAAGYLPFVSYATVTNRENTYMETFLMIEGSASSTGVAQGTISNALNGVGIPNATLTIRSGWSNTSYGDVVMSTQTNSNGQYSIALPLGNYTVQVAKQGFISTIVNIVVQDGTTLSQNGSMTPIVSGNDFRIVLTWGQNPSDLDSHVYGTRSDGSNFHVYYNNKNAYDNGVEVCNLDYDDTSSYGPETVTLKTNNSTPYYYYIYRYSGSGTMGTSEAKINVYQGENLVSTFNVPTDQGSGDYWNVFAVVNGELIVKDTITSSADISYVG